MLLVCPSPCWAAHNLLRPPARRSAVIMGLLNRLKSWFSHVEHEPFQLLPLVLLLVLVVKSMMDHHDVSGKWYVAFTQADSVKSMQSQIDMFGGNDVDGLDVHNPYLVQAPTVTGVSFLFANHGPRDDLLVAKCVPSFNCQFYGYVSGVRELRPQIYHDASLHRYIMIPTPRGGALRFYAASEKEDYPLKWQQISEMRTPLTQISIVQLPDKSKWLVVGTCPRSRHLCLHSSPDLTSLVSGKWVEEPVHYAPPAHGDDGPFFVVHDSNTYSVSQSNGQIFISRVDSAAHSKALFAPDGQEVQGSQWLRLPNGQWAAVYSQRISKVESVSGTYHANLLLVLMLVAATYILKVAKYRVNMTLQVATLFFCILGSALYLSFYPGPPRLQCTELIRTQLLAPPIPPLRVGLVMIFDKPNEMTDKSLKNKRHYCGKHGYDLLIANHLVNKTRPTAWSKILALKHYLKDYDVLLWVDVDTIILNTDVQMHQLMSIHGRLHDDWALLLAEDGNGPNTGMMLIRNTPAAHELLERWWNLDHLVHGHFPFEYEQRGLHYLLNTRVWKSRRLPAANDFKENRKLVGILPPCALNCFHLSFWDNPKNYLRSMVAKTYRANKYMPGDFLIHFAGYKGQARINLFDHYYSNQN